MAKQASTYPPAKPGQVLRDEALPAGRPSSHLDTRVVYCGDNLEQLRKLPDRCVDLVYIDPPFNSNRNYEVFWGETKEKRAFDDRHASTQAYIDFMMASVPHTPLQFPITGHEKGQRNGGKGILRACGPRKVRLLQGSWDEATFPKHDSVNMIL